MIVETVPFRGIIGYPITPFDRNGKIDQKILRNHIDRLIAGKVQGVAPLGSTGVLPYLSDTERELVTEVSIQQVAQQIFYRLFPLLDFIVKGGLPRTIAAGLEILGVEAGYIRVPMQELSTVEKDKLRKILSHLEIKEKKHAH